jgi:hypothetical protein
MNGAVQTLSKSIALHGFAVRLEYPSVLAERTDIIFSGYPEAAFGMDVDLTISLSRDVDDPVIWHVDDRDRHQTELSMDRAVSRAEWFVITAALGRWSTFIHVHAALVGNGTTSALLIGQSGRGKSTTAVTLATLGWDLYSDDVALVDRSTFAAWACPRPIKLDGHSRRLLEPLGISITDDQACGESIGRAYLPGVHAVDCAGPPVSSAFFLSPLRDDHPRITRMPKSESALRLMNQSSTDHDPAHGLTREAFALIEQIECYELVAADVLQTAKLVELIVVDTSR